MHPGDHPLPQRIVVPRGRKMRHGQWWYVPGVMWAFRTRKDAMQWIRQWERRQEQTYGPDWRNFRARVLDSKQPQERPGR